MTQNPISGVTIDYLKNNGWRDSLLKQLSKREFIAFRGGKLHFYGFEIKTQKVGEIIKRGGKITSDDLALSVKQKQVDLKIGLDVAWLSSKRIVDRILLITGDSDFVPAMKYARIEGVTVFLDCMNNTVKDELFEHSDGVR